MRRHASRNAILALALLLAACSTSGTPDSTKTPTTPATTPTSAVALYFVGDTAQGLRLYREFHRATTGTSPITTALSKLFTSKPLDPDYTNLWPADSKVNSVDIKSDVATIDLTFSSLNVGSESEMRAIDQLVWTATAAEPSVKKVRFTKDGKTVESFAGHVDTRGDFAREPSYEVLAPVWITSIDEGGTTKSPLTFGGLAQTFEANVEWEVRQGAKIVARGATTAGEAAPARTPWKVTVSTVSPGTYTIRAFTSSAKDGSLVAEDSKRIVVR